MRHVSSLLVVSMLVLCVPAVAEEMEPQMIVMSHMGGSLAVSLEAVETVFYMEKDGGHRFHLVWAGNAEGKTIQGAEAGEVWKAIRGRFEAEFVWVSHMGGTLGIAREHITSVFYMPAKDGKAATMRINYNGESKAVEGDAADGLWKELGR